MSHFPVLPSLALLALGIIGQARGSDSPKAEPLNLKFTEEAKAGWVFEQRVPGKPSLVFEESGLRFTSEGFDVLSREWPIGTAPFEISADILMTKGRSEQFNRSRGLVISLSSFPVTAMKDSDPAIVMAVTQTGVVMSAVQGGARIGAERRPGVWYFPGRVLGEKFATSMAGAGGQDFSVRWPTKVIDGTRLRLWAARKADGTVHFKIYNADGAATPWWEGEALLPQELREVPLRWLNVHTGREAADFADLSKFSLATGQGNGPADGILENLQARQLAGNESVLARPFPAATIPSSHPAKSRLLDKEKRDALRAKFNSPAFTDYKKVLLRCATPEWMAGLKMGQPDQNEAVFALTWALALSGDREQYLKPLLDQVDALIGPSDVYPQLQFEHPGRLRQNLFIREFWVHNMTALALAYDLVGEDLGKDRRDRIRFLLARMMKAYNALLDDGDWWFGGNPSNTIGVGNGCLGIIAVVMREEMPELSEKTIGRALNNIRKLFLGVDADGGCLEGGMYWSYGLSYPMLLGWALRETTGNDEGLLTSPQVKHATNYLAVNFGGDDKMIPFNDTQPWILGWPVLAAAGTVGDSPLARWMADHIAANYAAGSPAPEQARSTYSVPAFLYRDTQPAPKEFPGLPDVAVLESVQEGVLRSDGKALIPAMVTGVKGKGLLSTHHANEDQGSFVFYANGEMVLLDPGYFEQTAQKHSLPLIGDPEKMSLNATTPARLQNAWSQGKWRSVTVDATDAYNQSKKSPPCASRVRRIFAQFGDSALVILDDVLPRDPAEEVTAQYQAGVPATVSRSETSLETKSGPVKLHLFGPDLTLAANPRIFSKDWIFKKSGVAWTTLRGAYHADDKIPLITVLSTGNSKPDVHYADDKISVTLAKGASLNFRRTSEGWQVLKPDP